ncbi:hypothetical protein SDC9_196607 [bioreactor metagenome]|uniref:Uncharacterized protein n=1 Tax=bioreactor metagenome TaxID=1076179 RepID=A0A645IL00_9ZZZZ
MKYRHTIINTLDRHNKGFRFHVLNEITIRAKSSGRLDAFIVLKGCQHDHLYLRHAFLDFLQRVHSALARHADIQEGNVRLLRTAAFQRFFTIRAGCHNFYRIIPLQHFL